MNINAIVWAGCIVAAGLVVAGWLIAWGMVNIAKVIHQMGDGDE